MEQLQRLAETIAETYIRDLNRSNGNAIITHNEQTGKVKREHLASGLVDNCIYAAKNLNRENFEREAYVMLGELISLDGREYQITRHGKAVIDTLNRSALSKGTKRVSH
ncbi:hypothetical protein AAIO65_11975 [Erwinia amylovora]|uniref:hypothetical protein n=1 Tax=Erwinia amylovora TaxID=552 RepID=UPI000C077F12|nr:hypothetical protein [Erwinia amylovora]